MPSSVEIPPAHAFLGENLRKAEHARYSGAADEFLLKMGVGSFFDNIFIGLRGTPPAPPRTKKAM